MAESKAFLEICVDRGVLVLTVLEPQLEGDQAAAQLRQELLGAVEHHALSRVVLDMRHTRYVSSIAFWPLLALRRQLRDQEGRLIICGLTGSVHDVFVTTKMVSTGGSLDAPFETAPTREIALTRLVGPESASS